MKKIDNNIKNVKIYKWKITWDCKELQWDISYWSSGPVVKNPIFFYIITQQCCISGIYTFLKMFCLYPLIRFTFGLDDKRHFDCVCSPPVVGWWEVLWLCVSNKQEDPYDCSIRTAQPSRGSPAVSTWAAISSRPTEGKIQLSSCDDTCKAGEALFPNNYRSVSLSKCWESQGIVCFNQPGFSQVIVR